MLKRIAIVSVFVLIVASLGSCRSKKSSCGYSKVNVQEKTQEAPQDMVTASVD